LTPTHDVPCDVSPDGSRLAFVRATGDGSTGTLMTSALNGTDARALVDDVAISGVPCDWSPDGSTILASVEGALMLVTPQGDSTQLAGDGVDGYITNGLWSPDGARILMTMALEGDQFDVYTVAADGSKLTQITNSPQVDEAWSWLP
jgi:Tol biopolymer transport system component